MAKTKTTAAMTQWGGKVGIGLEKPQHPLHVSGTIHISADVNDDVLSWQGGGLRRESGEGGYVIGSDSSVMLHAGDHRGSVWGYAGFGDTTTTETVFLTSDGVIEFHTGLQTAVQTDNKWTKNFWKFTKSGSSMFPEGRISGHSFTSGPEGFGWSIDHPESSSVNYVEFDNLLIRNTLQTHIFQKDVIKAVNGYVLISDSGVIESSSASPYKVWFVNSSSATFEDDDILKYKDVDTESGAINEVIFQINGSANADGATTWYAVDNIVGTFSNLQAGGTAVRTSGGNILLDASSQHSPLIDVIDSGSTSNTKVRLGNLAGITSPQFNTLSGYGLWASGSAYLEGGINATEGLIGGWTISNTFISGGNVILDSSGIISVGNLSGVGDVATDNTGFRVNNSGEVLIKQGTSDYIRFDNTAVSMSATTFRLNTPDLDINSADKSIIVSNTIKLDGNDDGTLSVGHLTFEQAGTAFSGSGQGKIADGAIQWDEDGNVSFASNVRVGFTTPFQDKDISGMVFYQAEHQGSGSNDLTGSEGYALMYASGNIALQYGTSEENAVGYETDPFGNQALAWQSFPTSSGGEPEDENIDPNSSDGGFKNRTRFAIDKNKKYMFTAYIKRHTPTNEAFLDYRQEGRTYVGMDSKVMFSSGSEPIQNMNNPYFFHGDLPLDTWFLITAFVYPTGSTTDTGTGEGTPINFTGSNGELELTALYNCETGQKLMGSGSDCLEYTPGNYYNLSSPSGDIHNPNIRTFIWRSDAEDTYFRFLHHQNFYWDGNTKAESIMYPAVYECDGTQPKVSDLLDTGRLVAGGTYPDGTFISQDVIFAPTIAGITGKFSGSVVVGHDGSGITIDGLGKKIYQGTGTFGNDNTGFYLDSEGSMSLKDSLKFSDGDLTISGTVSASAGEIGGFNIGTDTINSDDDKVVLRSIGGVGSLTASEADIGGWKVDSNTIYNDGLLLKSTGATNVSDLEKGIFLSGSGAGHLAGGNISWTKDGDLSIKNASLELSNTNPDLKETYDVANSKVVVLYGNRDYHYATYEPNTIINILNNDREVTQSIFVEKAYMPGEILNADLEAGYIIEANKPLSLVQGSTGVEPAALIFAGKTFYFFNDRDHHQILTVYSPFESASVSMSLSTENDGTFSTLWASASIAKEGIATLYGTGSAHDDNDWDIWFKVTSDVPIVAAHTSHNGTNDATILMPPSAEVIHTDTSTPPDEWIVPEPGVTITDVHANGSSGSFATSTPAVPFQMERTGDASGGDSQQGIGLETLGDTYIIPHKAGGYQIMAVEPCTVTASIFNEDGTLTMVQEYDLLDASKSSPKYYGSGSDAYAWSSTATASENEPGVFSRRVADIGMFFEGSAPFALRTNTPSNGDEYNVLGYRRNATPVWNKNIRYPWQPADNSTISGDKIKTGKIQSNNWTEGGTLGSEWDLNDGTVRLGGDTTNTSILLSGSGEGKLADGNISWDTGGNTTIQGSVTIASDVTVNADVAVGSLPNFPTNDKLLTYYDFSAQQGSLITDNSGNGQAMTITATDVDATWTLDSPHGGAFTGSSGNGAYANTGNSFSCGKEITISAWAKDDGRDENSNNMLWTIDTDNVSLLNLYFYENRISLNSDGNGTTNRFTLGGVNVARDDYTASYHNFTVVNSETLNKSILYIDGVVVGSASFVDSTTTEDGFYIARYGDAGSAYYWYGKIAQVRIYDRVLAENEIEALYLNPGSGEGTVLSGDQITTGKIQSNNWAANTGSEINLNEGTIQMGGSGSPDFAVDKLGNVTASSGRIGGWNINSKGIESVNGGMSILSDSSFLADSLHYKDGESTIDIRSTTAADFRLSMGSTLYQYPDNAGIIIYSDDDDADKIKLFEVSYNLNNVGVTDYTASIGGWNFSHEKLFAANGGLAEAVVLDATNAKISVANDLVKMYYNGVTDYGITDSTNKFKLGYTNEIAGWQFDNKKIRKFNDGVRDTGMEINSETGIFAHGEGTASIATFAGHYSFVEGANSAYSGSGIIIDDGGYSPLGNDDDGGVGNPGE